MSLISRAQTIMTPVDNAIDRPPIVLIVDDQEWSTRSLESVLASRGYGVTRAFTAEKCLEQVRLRPPDLVFVSAVLPDQDGIALCQRLRDENLVSDATPILMTSPERAVRDLRLRAMEAGAWDFVSYPIDALELSLRLNAFMRAKFESDLARERCLVDAPTGLYNVRGLELRAEELRSLAFRDRQSIACIVITTLEIPGDDHGRSASAVVKIGQILKDVGRTSDVLGRLGPSDFAVLAPSTGPAGAVKLTERFGSAVQHWADADSTPVSLRLRAGYKAVENVREHPIEAKDLLVQATIALRRAKQGGNGNWIEAF